MTPAVQEAEALYRAVREALEARAAGGSGRLEIAPGLMPRIARDGAARLHLAERLRGSNHPLIRELLAAEIFDAGEALRRALAAPERRLRNRVAFLKRAGGALAAGGFLALVTGGAGPPVAALAMAAGLAGYGLGMHDGDEAARRIARAEDEIRALEELRRLILGQ